ncbi:HupE/UreJ family protein [Enterovibrio nigricans]|uniref:Urease accessory protein n=1 Tax=Enterovibrio nigricans DSM 22720 TaxID=1121868 RepID=A0A1T4UYZ6_9GAMM|nr:HupE/UreJ family protein [Enterovibrio nigricans]PKF50086.1 urease accessory protein UreJ [Enterovibrio nigricans]SKA57866.1 urease accessory protein [Enterovibrio nigricans DSM 22720]
MKRNGFQAATLLMALLPLTASAHTGHEVNGFVAGLLHPLTGADHLIALVAVGLWAVMVSRQGFQRASSLIPVAFLAVMALGAFIALAGLKMPLMETGIAMSVIFLGLLLVAGKHHYSRLSFLLAGVFALVHGIAHGVEMPYAASFGGYFAGFLMASGALIFSGSLAAKMCHYFKVERLIMPLTGGAIALTGMYSLAI